MNTYFRQSPKEKKLNETQIHKVPKSIGNLTVPKELKPFNTFGSGYLGYQNPLINHQPSARKMRTTVIKQSKQQ